ncbi:MAG: hypothetical protein HQK58_10855 [Deltaproteobacteria bacterium]|nr:hypothetical protein [Deltaproteobacteria bacterium]
MSRHPFTIVILQKDRDIKTIRLAARTVYAIYSIFFIPLIVLTLAVTALLFWDGLAPVKADLRKTWPGILFTRDSGKAGPQPGSPSGPGGPHPPLALNPPAGPPVVTKGAVSDSFPTPAAIPAAKGAITATLSLNRLQISETATEDASAESPGAETKSADNSVRDAIKSAGCGEVDISDFTIRPQNEERIFAFKLNNVSSRQTTGYIVAIGIGKSQGAVTYLSSPAMSLKEGRPANFKDAEYFAISRYKYISGTFHISKKALALAQVEIIVYSSSGEIVCVKRFKVGT